MEHLTEHVSVELGERSYAISIGSGLLELLGTICLDVAAKGTRVFVVTDSHVGPLYLETACESLRAAGFQVSSHEVEAGEPSKSVEPLGEIWQQAIQARLDRKSLFVALGGGVVGDLCGFAAASTLRGIPFVQVPTSLLAMVDSAVGGKTGINLPQGKNLVGAFYQPQAVVADLEVLTSLPSREFHAGLAEVIKYGVIWDEALFRFLEERADEIEALDPACLSHLVKRSCEIKAEVVRQDEREGGLRAILNFGHTLGHAIENVLGYGEWLHGEAIAAGMVYAARVSERVKGFPPEETDRLIRLFQRYELPVDWSGLEWDAVFRAMTADKKAENAVPRFVLAEKMGKVGLPEEVAKDILEPAFHYGTRPQPMGLKPGLTVDKPEALLDEVEGEDRL